MDTKPDPKTIAAIQRHEHKRAGAFLRHLVDANFAMSDEWKQTCRSLAQDLEDGAALMPFPGFDEATGQYETPPFLRRD